METCAVNRRSQRKMFAMIQNECTMFDNLPALEIKIHLMNIIEKGIEAAEIRLRYGSASIPTKPPLFLLRMVTGLRVRPLYSSAAPPALVAEAAPPQEPATKELWRPEKREVSPLQPPMADPLSGPTVDLPRPQRSRINQYTDPTTQPTTRAA
ncbi:hypothetical protein RR48_15472 [Papilio machaon]|uniref:Uncharacterized protein n=1 Tax=Papilio machaon TaxID=76193 RepID=A0A194R0G5_PAPMA|nr:hypothetical protein RR48_15472 [Papilio machaon]